MSNSLSEKDECVHLVVRQNYGTSWSIMAMLVTPCAINITTLCPNFFIPNHLSPCQYHLNLDMKISALILNTTPKVHTVSIPPMHMQWHCFLTKAYSSINSFTKHTTTTPKCRSNIQVDDTIFFLHTNREKYTMAPSPNYRMLFDKCIHVLGEHPAYPYNVCLIFYVSKVCQSLAIHS